jgi:hypothetical protein
MLKGVLESWITKKISSPSISEAKRQPDVNLNFLGGKGMYHKTAHTAMKTNRFKLPHQSYSSPF